MRSLSFLLLSFSLIFISNAQTSVKSVDKPPLDFSILGKWPYVEYPRISNDGKYAFYTYKESDRETLVIKATEGSWEKRIEDVGSSNAVMTENSRFVVVKKKDSLFVITLSKDQTETIANVASYKTPQDGSGEWLAYQLNIDNRDLIIRSLNTGKEIRFTSVSEYMFSKEGNVLLLKEETGEDKYRLQLVYLSNGKLVTIWQGIRADNISFDIAGSQLAFITEGPDNSSTNALWYYRQGMDTAVVFADNKTAGIEEGLSISKDDVCFNNDGSKIFFYLEPPLLPKPKPGYVSVDVWSYLDEKLQSEQLQSGSIKNYLSVINIENAFKQGNNRRVIRIEQEGDEVNDPIEKLKSDYVLVNNRKGNAYESYWNPGSFISVFLVSTKDGSRKLLKNNISYHSSLHALSPGEKFVISYDGNQNCFLSYEIAKEVTRNISKDVSCSLNANAQEYAVSYGRPYFLGIVANNEKSVILYDEYDIWQVDPLGLKKPINLTNGYGRKNEIVFRLLDHEEFSNSLFNRSNNILITAFNKRNKDNGIYSIIIDNQRDPELLCAGPFVIYTTAIPGGVVNVFKPIRAKNSSLYLISKMNSSEPPNYFVTKDFKRFTSLSAVRRPQYFNWFTTELIEWNTFDGTKSQGILYKPENFDPTKKYPIIFVYYEWKSEKLNEFIYPKLIEAELNIPYFVSNDYLVFTPDIHYKIGYPGESACNSVLSAAKYLSKFNWVDSTKMGITGHSFGGYETNYLITHTNVFAAAVSAAGTCNFISGYGSLRGDGTGRHWIYENTQSRIGVTLWGGPELYIRNSPIFNADNVVTPVLLMNNKHDNAVPFSQGVEFFTALRRLGRRAWMLQYDNGSHDVVGKEAEDFTKRISQFFDHFLKGSPAPRWITRGVPAKLKGVDDGMELDMEIHTPSKD